MYTGHGHHIAGSPKGPEPLAVARCGGPGICPGCNADFTSFVLSNQSTPTRTKLSIVTEFLLDDPKDAARIKELYSTLRNNISVGSSRITSDQYETTETF